MICRYLYFLYKLVVFVSFFFFSSRRRHTRWPRDWSSDVCFFRSRRPRDDRGQAPHAPRIRTLDGASRLCGDAARRRGAPVRRGPASSAALGAGIRGDGMMASARFGAELHQGGVTFRFWAPAAKRVEIMLDRAHPMPALAEGWFETTIPDLRAGTLYKYRIEG